MESAFDMDNLGSDSVIKVFGVGGAGGNALNYMVSKLNRPGIEFVALNTDKQALLDSKAPTKVVLGHSGLGAGARPEVGYEAADEVRDEIARQLKGTNLLFITAGMGGGTGTGASCVIAEEAQKQNILTVAIVTKPFSFEGRKRMEAAEAGIFHLKNRVHSLVTVLNDKLEPLLGEEATMQDCFAKADDILYDACRGVVDLKEGTGTVNLSFRDVMTVISARGTAMMGVGEASADQKERAISAVRQAIACPLLEEANLACARGVLVNIACRDVLMSEVRAVMEAVRDVTDPEAFLVHGVVDEEAEEGVFRVLLMATGLEKEGLDNSFVKFNLFPE